MLMAGNMLDLYKLKIFSVVVQEGSFSAAAEQLLMTQSAVSQHIKELEISLGQQLFQRGWRGVTLTPHGEILQCYTVEIFALVAQAENAIKDVDQLQSGRVSIGATPGIGVYIAPDWVQQFRARYPQLTVALQTGITSQMVSEVRGQRLDMAFIEGELDEPQNPRLKSLVLEEIEQQVVVGFKHPFWDRDQLNVAELANQPLIVRQANSQSRIWLEDKLHDHAITPVIGAEFDNLESIKRAVSIGSCLTLLPPYVVQAEVEQGLLRMIPIQDKPFTRSLKLIWDSSNYFSPVSLAFLTILSQHFPVLRALLKEMKAKG